MGTLIKIVCFLAFALAAHGQTTHYAADAERDTIQSLVDDAGTVSGDTIVVPSGDATWTTNVNLGNKDLSIIGAGIGSTIIRRTSDATFFDTSDTASRIAGFDMRGYASAQDDYFIRHNSAKWAEFDHCRFENTRAPYFSVAIRFDNQTTDAPPQGLVHNCHFIGDLRVLVYGDEGDFGVNSDIWHVSSQGFGASTTVFIEDCYFEQSENPANVVDASYAGCYVFRYNTVVSTGTFSGYIETHGVDSASERGFKVAEIYGNTLIRDTSTGNNWPILIRGGMVVLYDNLLTVRNGGTWPNNRIFIDNNNRSSAIDGNTVRDGNYPHPRITSPYWHHDGGDNASALVASGASWTTDAWAGMVVYNLTDGSTGAITANTGTTVTATLAGGSENDWDDGDRFLIVETTGTHDGGDNQAGLTDSSKSWVASYDDGTYWVYNLTDGSSGVVTANGATTATATLSGGTDNDWDDGDEYKISRGYPWRDQAGVGHDASKYTGGAWPAQAMSIEFGAFEWDNMYDNDGDGVGDLDTDFARGNDGSKALEEGRDFHNDTEYSYTPISYPHPSASAFAPVGPSYTGRLRFNNTGSQPVLTDQTGSVPIKTN